MGWGSEGGEGLHKINEGYEVGEIRREEREAK
jgi:hypothetical protein